jgi:hypothetical protein
MSNTFIIGAVIVFLVLLALPTIRDFAGMLRMNDQVRKTVRP